MEIDNLKAFLAVAETGSFSQAADRMHLTQPAISKRVAQLERQFDALTFGRTVRLTEAGDSLAYRANLILQQVEDTERAIRNLNGEVGDQPPRRSLAPAPRPKQVHSKTPWLSLDLHFMDSEVAHERIIHGELEMAIITLAPSPHERLIAEPIWRDELVFVCSRAHDLAIRKTSRLMSSQNVQPSCQTRPRLRAESSRGCLRTMICLWK